MKSFEFAYIFILAHLVFKTTLEYYSVGEISELTYCRLIRFFTKMPNEHYMVEAKLLLCVAAEDIPRSEEIRTAVKDIWDIRMAKLRTSMDALMKVGGSYGRLDHLTLMEINSAKPLLPHAMDQLYRLRKVCYFPWLSYIFSVYIPLITWAQDQVSTGIGVLLAGVEKLISLVK